MARETVHADGTVTDQLGNFVGIDQPAAARIYSPLERICRQADEHRAYVLAHPAEFSAAEVERAQLTEHQSKRLSIASTLRYDD